MYYVLREDRSTHSNTTRQSINTFPDNSQRLRLVVKNAFTGGIRTLGIPTCSGLRPIEQSGVDNRIT